MCVCLDVSDSVTPVTVAHQAPLSMGFSRQEYWSVLPFPSPGDLTDPGIKPAFPESPALTGRFFTTEPHINKARVHKHKKEDGREKNKKKENDPVT